MSMSTNVIGFRPPDDKFKKFAAIWHQCEDAGVSMPREVEEFFQGVAPDPQGVKVHLKEGKDGPVKPWKEDDGEGFEIDLTKLPKDVKIIRFWNSW